MTMKRSRYVARSVTELNLGCGGCVLLLLICWLLYVLILYGGFR